MRYVLILGDSLGVENDSVQYGIELARRVGAGVVLLILLERTRPKNTANVAVNLQQAQEELGRHVASAARAGVTASGMVRVGPPRSELLKHLAGEGVPEALVWAGGPGVRDGPNRGRTHWLEKTKGVLGCPVVVPVARELTRRTGKQQ